MMQQTYKRMTMIIASTNMGGQKIPGKINKLWPLSTDMDNADVSDKAKEVLMSFKRIEAAKKLSNARRTKDTSRG